MTALRGTLYEVPTAFDEDAKLDRFLLGIGEWT